MPLGEAGVEKVNLNVDPLWSGGPFKSDVGLRLCHTARLIAILIIYVDFTIPPLLNEARFYTV